MPVKKAPDKKDIKAFPEGITSHTFGIAVAEWNKTITSALLEACVKCLKEHHIPESRIIVKWVPGSFELPLAAQWLAGYTDCDAVICLGCVIKGETPHNHYISEAVSLGISKLSLEFNIPVIFGVLTTDNEAQAVARSGGDKGNKGEDAALAAIHMLVLRSEFEKS
jgi:6,7-dimethyl-8-ribityllumazine synthase